MAKRPHAPLRSPWSRLTSLAVVAALGATGCGDETSGPLDSGAPPDAGATDTGPTDTGPTDTGPTDTGPADTGVDPFPLHSCATVEGPCQQFGPTERDALLDAANELESGTTLILGAGRIAFDNSLILRGASGVTLLGQGIDETTLDFADTAAQTNGVDVVGDDFSIADLTIANAPKDALRIEDSARIVIQRIKVTWDGGPSSDNGSYGIYPVRVTDVLIEDCEAYNSADAGIYVGQTQRAIVRRNVAQRNVAGIEIENTQYADVYENTVEDNTAGLVVFDLPGNPIFSRDVVIRDNTIRSNNRANFAPTDGVNEVTTVSQIPAGTGTFVLAGRRVEIRDNVYQDNASVAVALLSGLVIQDDPLAWATPYDDVEGRIAGQSLAAAESALLNFAGNEIWVHGNTFAGGGDAPDAASPMTRPLGAVLGVLYPPSGPTPVDDILYDGIGEEVTPGLASTNVNHICVSGNEDATVGVMNLPVVQAKLLAFLSGQSTMPPTLADTFRPEAPFAPFDCQGFTTGPIPELRLDFLSGDDDFAVNDCDGLGGTCLEFAEGEEDALLDAVNELEDDSTIVLGAGRFAFDNALILRLADGITLLGQGMDRTTLDFGGGATQFNGLDVIGDRFTVADLTILDAPKDALRIEDSDDVVVRRVRTTWTLVGDSSNGSYGIYPVRSTNVLIEDCEAFNSADAGIYVGQTRGAVVRNNTAAQNVAGLEIENTQYAEVYGNLLTDNTAGLVVFDLPGNPVVGRDVWLHHNEVVRNNRGNFAPTDGANEVTTVSQIPAGTGTFALASRRVRISDNLYLENQSAAVSFLSGLVIQGDPARWAIPLPDLVGGVDGLDLEAIPGQAVLNFRTKEVLLSNNHFFGNGVAPDGDSPTTRPIGAILALTYTLSGQGLAVDDILYDGIEETVDPTNPENNTNRNRICVAGNSGATYATLNLPVLEQRALAFLGGQGEPPSPMDLYRPEAPFAPFDCASLSGAPIGPVRLPIPLD